MAADRPQTADATPPPATGGWREGDPVGRRKFVEIGALDLELGGHLPAVRLAYETWGELADDGSNAVLVLHALTGDSHATGPAVPGHPTAGWWGGIIGDGAVVDPSRWFVVTANVLGGCQGSTGPSSPAPDGRPWGSRFPRTTVGDQVRAEVRLADALGVRRWAVVLGGSMGGMRALEWLAGHSDRVAAGLVLAVGAAASADQIGTQTAQTLAITGDPGWHGGDYHHLPAGHGPHRGLGVARRIAHLTYRSAAELETRFGRAPQDGERPLGERPGEGRFAVQSYLDHQATKLAHRFDAGTYVALTDAMNTWDVGRGRGGLEHALAGIRAPVVVAGIDSDRLYPLPQQRLLADAIPTTVGDLRVVASIYGHDGFLLEREQVGAVVAELLTLTGRRSAHPRAFP